MVAAAANRAGGMRVLCGAYWLVAVLFAAVAAEPPARALAAPASPKRRRAPSGAFLAASGGRGADLEVKAAKKEEGRDVPGWGQPTWGGRSFDDSLANWNPWGKVKRVPVVSDLDPVAPQDRLDKAIGPFGATFDAAPLTPGELNVEFVPSAPKSLQTDYVAPYSFPRTFPKGEQIGAPPGAYAEPEIPIERQYLHASHDRLSKYPLVAPGDRITSSRVEILGNDQDPHPVSSTDRLDPRFSKYIDQVHDRELKRESRIRLDRAFNKVDADDNGVISREEYDAALSSQNKSNKEGEHLWSRVTSGKADGMSKEEFSRLHKVGFDLGKIPRTDVASVIPFIGGPQRGFWGSGAACPEGSWVTGARLKVMAQGGDKKDDTGLNGVGLRCSSGREVQTIEGPDGTWTGWADCPAGQRVYSVRAKMKPFIEGTDNTAIESLELGCRAPDLSAMGKLRFGGGNAVTAAGFGALARGGSSGGAGWSQEQMCSPSAAVCGAQAHVVRDQGEADDMGTVSLRVYCCLAPVDCTAACGEANGGPSTVGCQVCRQAAGAGGPAVL